MMTSMCKTDTATLKEIKMEVNQTNLTGGQQQDAKV